MTQIVNFPRMLNLLAKETFHGLSHSWSSKKQEILVLLQSNMIPD